MTFLTKNKLKYFQFDIFNNSNVDHAIFTRVGGTSSAPFNELNVGSTVGDDQQSVNENRRRSFATIGRDTDSMFDSWLVHGTQALIADDPAPPSIEQPRPGDIILSNNSRVTLFMRYADCVPILLYDPENEAVGIVHAGWKGTLERVASKAVEKFISAFGTNPANLLAGIGPSIAQHHYEVGPEVVEGVLQTFGVEASEHIVQKNGMAHFDLWSSNISTLNDVGVTQIENPEICTACNITDWYSHRAENGNTGRFGTLFGLKPR